MNTLQAAISKIRSIADHYCERQMYVWPGFDPMDPHPAEFFRQQEIDFDGELFIRYPVKRTFNPLPKDRIDETELSLGITLPIDYKILLVQFGAFVLPGKAGAWIQSPEGALGLTRSVWCREGKPLSVLAISTYDATCDGNAIGFVRQGDSFEPAIYEFDHERVHRGDSPSLWTTKIGDSLADFILHYLAPYGQK